MENEFLFDITKEYFAEKNVGNRKWNFMTFWYGEYISKEKLESAVDCFANYDPKIEVPILLVNDNCFGSITEGILVTNIKIYYRLQKSFSKPIAKGIIQLKEITNINIDSKIFGAWFIVNNNKEALISSFSKSLENEVKPIREILQIFVNEIQLRKGKFDDRSIS